MSEYVDELNARALIEAVDDLRASYEARFVFLENRVAVLSDLVTSMQRVTGEVLASVMGRGATVSDEG